MENGEGVYCIFIHSLCKRQLNTAAEVVFAIQKQNAAYDKIPTEDKKEEDCPSSNKQKSSSTEVFVDTARQELFSYSRT
jgi:hypothetical protein